jgi:hypothetical protein
MILPRSSAFLTGVLTASLFLGSISCSRKESDASNAQIDDRQKIQEEVVRLRASHDKLGEEYAQLRKENNQLRQENQALRLLLADQLVPALAASSTHSTNAVLSETNLVAADAAQPNTDSLTLAEPIESATAPSSIPSTNVTLSATNGLSPEAIQSKTNWLTVLSGTRHNSRCRYYRATAGRYCGSDEGKPCKLCGG